MTIVASKFKAIVINFVFILLLSLLVTMLLSLVSFDKPQLIALIMFLSLTFALLIVFCRNDNVEIDENGGIIGGASNFTYRKEALFFRFRKQHFMTKADIDEQKSLKPNFIASLLGEFAFYDRQGRGFKIKRYLFSTEDFKVIQSKVAQIYSMKI